MCGKALSVAFVLPSFAGGGAERVTLLLASGIGNAGFAPEIVVLNGEGPLAPLVPHDSPVHDLGIPRLRRALPALLVTLRRIRPTVVVSSLGYVSVALLACRMWLPGSIRIVLREANLPSLSLPNAPHPRLISLAYHQLYRRSDAVICTSERMAAEFRSRFGVPPERLHLLPNPVDELSVRQASSPHRRAPGPGPRFVAAGRLTRQKGFDRLIDMMRTAPQNAHLTILGEGPDRAHLESVIARSGLAGRVEMPGFDPTPWSWIAGADALLLSSRWEGMPNVVLEALACGTPVIATPEAGGIAEIMSAAPPGAVVVAEAGDAFIAAMGTVAPSRNESPRSSLLPMKNQMTAVASRFGDILSGLP